MARAGVTPERLTAVAAELADEIGFENLTVSAVAGRFGVSVASLYSHIRNAEEVRVRVALLALAEMADAAAEALAGRSGKDALVAFADAYRTYARTHPGRYTAARMRLDPQTAQASAAIRHSQMIRSILRGYDMPEAEHDHAVRFMASIFHGFAALEASGGFAYSPGIDASWRRALDALDVTLSAWPTS
jgi:AcrR family transcriptional regulator